MFIEVIVYISVLKEIFEREPVEDKHKQKNIFLRCFFFPNVLLPFLACFILGFLGDSGGGVIKGLREMERIVLFV